MIATTFLLLLPLWTMAQDPSAYDIYAQLLEESVDSSKRYSEGKVAWTLGRSGKSHNILNLLSPSSDTLDEFVQSLPFERRELFLRGFFRKEIDEFVQSLPPVRWELFLRGFFRKEISEGAIQELEEAWQAFLAKERQGADTPLASLSEETAQEIFDGTFPGLEGQSLQSTYDKQWNLRAEMKLKFKQFPFEFTSQGADNNNRRWILYSHPQENYGDFEEMLRRLRSVLGSTDSPSNSGDTQFTMTSFDDDVMEKNKVLASLANVLEARINLPSDRWMRFYNTALAARMLSGDSSGIRKITSWNWDQSPSIPRLQEFVDDYGVSLETAQKALEHIAWAEGLWGPKVLDPFIFMQNAPFIGEVKKKLFKSLIAEFVKMIAGAEEQKDVSQLIWLLQDIWMGSLHLESEAEAESLLRPRPRERLGQILSHRPPSSAGKETVDVNTHCLGN